MNWIGTLGFAALFGSSALAAQEFTLETPTGKLQGTLELPAGNGPFPVALIIAGSGPTDRNGNSPVGLNTNAYKLLAEGLAQNGVASLRYDKRGVAASAAAGLKEADLRFDTYVNDAVALIEHLGKDARFSKRFVIGHSEGSLIGMLAAQKTTVAGFVSIAGAGRPANELLLEQLKAQLPADLYAESERIISELKAGRTVPNPAAKLPAQFAQALFRPSVQPYLTSWMKFDPALEIAKLTAPVLVVQGRTDVQTNAKDAERLAVAAKVKPVMIEGMNHTFKVASLEQASQQAAYTNPALPLAPGFLERIVEFLRAR